jgi:hypothetical protein
LRGDTKRNPLPAVANGPLPSSPLTPLFPIVLKESHTTSKTFNPPVNLEPIFSINMPTSPKKASFTRRFTDMVATKTPRRMSGSRKGENNTPPPAFATPPASPRSTQPSNNSSPQSGRYQFDVEHRLPKTFLPFLSTDVLKGLDVFGGDDNTARDTFDLSQSSGNSEEAWLRVFQNRSAYSFPETRKMSTSSSMASSEMSGSPVKEVTIGWICEDGFRPIGLAD